MEVKRVKFVDYGEPKGLGVVAMEPIKKGEYVVSYLGDVVFESEADKRELEYEAKGLRHYYLYVTNVRKRNPDNKNKLERLVIDPTIPKHDYGWARLMNCSKSHPNIKPRSIRLPRYPFVELQFFATRRIQAGEELLFDYDPNSRDVGFSCL